VETWERLLLGVSLNSNEGKLGKVKRCLRIPFWFSGRPRLREKFLGVIWMKRRMRGIWWERDDRFENMSRGNLRNFFVWIENLGGGKVVLFSSSARK
jgi:hypothetical protein